MLENLFLTYENYSLREDPKNLKIIFEEILASPLGDRTADDIYVKQLINNILWLTEFNDPQIAKREKYGKMKDDDLFGWLYNIAFEAVYMYRDEFCEKECPVDYCFDYYEILKKSGLNSREPEPKAPEIIALDLKDFLSLEI
ncbi:MAG: hypothetical protein JW882_04560 [Deltaproteobacteria bacterium]|nr:hypothetical protein [Deltaproteobacteria bacterium]